MFFAYIELRVMADKIERDQCITTGQTEMYLFNLHPQSTQDDIDFSQGGDLYFKNPLNECDVFAVIKMPECGWTKEILESMEGAIASAYIGTSYDIFLGDRWVGSSEL